jgi:hypothetical protein
LALMVVGSSGSGIVGARCREGDDVAVVFEVCKCDLRSGLAGRPAYSLDAERTVRGTATK